MENESFLSGYCRGIDDSRMVVAVTEDAQLIEIDCDYETCPHTPSCTIAGRIRELLQG